MDSLSIIVTAHNNGAVLARTLHSVEAAVAFLRTGGGPCHDAPVEIVVVDDGSRDQTTQVLAEVTRGKSLYQVVRRDRSSSAACARNTGAAASTGSLLLFLDGDDLYYPDHIATCCAALADPALDFVKTGMRMADPVHPDWKARIEASSLINLCIRRPCHFAVGGVPDYHLFVRAGESFKLMLQLSHHCEDQFYNQLIMGCFRGRLIARDTVEYLRYPGNAYDRQYEKFSRPFGAYQEALPPETVLRLQLNQVLMEYRIQEIRATLAQTAHTARTTSAP